MFTALTIAKNGFFGGNPETVLNAPVDIVIATKQYIEFLQDFDDTSIELNKEK